MLNEYMVSLGYNINDICMIRNTYPVNRFTDKRFCIAVRDVFDVLLEFGYTEKQILMMTLERPHIFCYTKDLLIKKLNYYLNILGSKKIVIKITLDFPTLFSYDMESVDDKIDNLRKLGYIDDVIIKSIKSYPEILGLSIEESVKNMLNELNKLGFSRDEALKITSKNMSIFGRDIESIKNTILKLESYGYSRGEVILMIKKHPSILNFSIVRLEQRINDMVLLGFTLEDVLNILQKNPSLFGNDFDTIRDKKIFYDSIGLINLFVISPENLMQGISKSYARYMYLKSIGIDILENTDGYKQLFIGEKRFRPKYKVGTDDLVLVYNVDEYMRKVKTR